MTDYKCKAQDIGKTVLEVLINEGARTPETPCGGRGSCGKCLIRLRGNISKPTENEISLLGSNTDLRLACLTMVEGDFSYELPEAGYVEVLTDFSEKNLINTVNNRKLLAVDIGTTTVAMYIIENVAVTEKHSFLNPQRIHGADVISRLVFAKEGAQALKSELVDAIASYCKDIDYAVICGNTAMEHFITGEDSSGIAMLPFKPASLFGCEHSLPFAKKTYLAPCVAAYVGGDITCGAVAVNLDKVNELTLYIDIGTNGEIVLADSERMLCCSAAAGPAFEGANIECGCTARAGAVSRVWYDNGLKHETIDNVPATGICGSGLIDCIAALLDAGLLDETGKLDKEKYYIGEVYISQKDIRALQSAKAAIAAGIKTLVYEMKKPLNAIKKVIVAGGFGMHIDADNACTIGLIPQELEGRIEFMGNCAGLGAVNCALSENERVRTENFAKRLEYIELSGHKKFNELYVEEMFFEG